MPLAPPQECTYPTVDACYRDIQAHAKGELYCIILQVKRQGRHDICCDRGGIHKATAQLRRGTETKKTGCKFRAVLSHDRGENVWRLRVTNPYHNHPPSTSPAVHAKHRQEEREIQRPLIERGMARGDTTKTIYENILAAYPGTITQFADVGNMIQGLKKIMALQASGSNAVAPQQQQEQQQQQQPPPPQQQHEQQPYFELANAAGGVSVSNETRASIHAPIPSKYKATRLDLTFTEDLRKAKAELARTSEITRTLQERVDFLEKERGSLEWRVGRLEAALFHVAGQAMAHGAAFAQPPPSTIHQPPVGPRWGGQGILYPVQPPQPTQVSARGSAPVAGGPPAQPPPQPDRQPPSQHQFQTQHANQAQQQRQLQSQSQPQPPPQEQHAGEHTFRSAQPPPPTQVSAASQPIQVDSDGGRRENSGSNGEDNDDDDEEEDEEEENDDDGISEAE